jgi:hypothetical protein
MDVGAEVTIYVADGTYGTIALPGLVGSNKVVVQGNSSNVGGVVIGGNPASGTGIRIDGGWIRFADITVAANFGIISNGPTARVELSNNMTIESDNRCIAAQSKGLLNIYNGSQIRLKGSPVYGFFVNTGTVTMWTPTLICEKLFACSQFLRATNASMVEYGAATFTVESGAAIANQGTIERLSLVQANNTIPGGNPFNITGGSELI